MATRSKVRLSRWLVAAFAGFASPGQAQTPAPVYLRHPTVVDTAHLRGADMPVTLAGLQGWAGDPAHDLQSVIAQAGDAVTCTPQPDASAQSSYVCKLPNGADVAELALALGDAKALDTAPAGYHTLQAAAEAGHRGVWASQAASPAILQHPVVQTTAQVAANGRSYPLYGLEGFGAPYYTLQLQRFIDSHGGELTCTDKDGSDRYVCTTKEGTDIATVALLEGLARASADAPPEYRADQAQASQDKSGFWFNPSPQTVTQFAPLPQPQPMPSPGCCSTASGSSEPILSYNDGIPVAIIANVPAHFVYIREIGWGYYDHVGSWHLAPAAYRAELSRAFPKGPAVQPRGRSLPSAAPTGLLRALRTTPPAGFRNPGVLPVAGALQGQLAQQQAFARQQTFRATFGSSLALARPMRLAPEGIGRINPVRPPAVTARPLVMAPRR